MTRYIVLALICSTALSAFAGESAEFRAAYRAGRADAQHDIARNYLAVEEYGREAVWEEDYGKIAERRFGVHVKRVAGCIVDDQILGHAKGYNEISEPAIKRRFGRDVLVDARVEASDKWERSRNKKT
jgi:hypothetical protein